MEYQLFKVDWLPLKSFTGKFCFYLDRILDQFHGNIVKRISINTKINTKYQKIPFNHIPQTDSFQYFKKQSIRHSRSLQDMSLLNDITISVIFIASLNGGLLNMTFKLAILLLMARNSS